MGDHRATVKIEFTMHGHTAKMDSWMNWPAYEVDRRVIEFFEDNAAIAMRRFEDEQEKAEREYRKEQIEASEREELARLKAKYETNGE